MSLISASHLLQKAKAPFTQRETARESDVSMNSLKPADTANRYSIKKQTSVTSARNSRSTQVLLFTLMKVLF